MDFVLESALSWWVVWVQAVFLREDTRGQLNCCKKAALTCVRISEEGRFLLRGNKLKCCFPVDSSPNIQSDINRRLGCKSYHACKLVTVVYSFLNNVRQFLSRVLWYLTNTTNEKKTGLEGVPATPELASAEQWGWGQGADPCPCQLMEWHFCPPKARWATNMSGSLERNFEDSNLDKTFWFRGVFKSKRVAHVFTIHAEDSFLPICHCWLGRPQNGLLHPEIFWKTWCQVDWAFAGPCATHSPASPCGFQLAFSDYPRPRRVSQLWTSVSGVSWELINSFREAFCWHQRGWPAMHQCFVQCFLPQKLS